MNFNILIKTSLGSIKDGKLAIGLYIVAQSIQNLIFSQGT